jgi:AcrR family transcriptional regulator
MGMSRWEPNARERLVGAAVELFLDRGYESVTVTEIAERAGLTKRTFFRHFADKREILFGDQEPHRRLFADAIAGMPASATPLEVVGAGLAAFAGGFPEEARDFLAKRQAIIGGNPDLRERELLKRAALTAVMAEALRARGVKEPTASLAAEVGALALNAAYLRWLEPANRQTFPKLAAKSLRELGSATEALR